MVIISQNSKFSSTRQICCFLGVQCDRYAELGIKSTTIRHFLKDTICHLVWSRSIHQSRQHRVGRVEGVWLGASIKMANSKFKSLVINPLLTRDSSFWAKYSGGDGFPTFFVSRFFATNHF